MYQASSSAIAIAVSLLACVSLTSWRAGTKVGNDASCPRVLKGLCASQRGGPETRLVSPSQTCMYFVQACPPMTHGHIAMSAAAVCAPLSASLSLTLAAGISCSLSVNDT